MLKLIWKKGNRLVLAVYKLIRILKVRDFRRHSASLIHRRAIKVIQGEDKLKISEKLIEGNRKDTRRKKTNRNDKY